MELQDNVDESTFQAIETSDIELLSRLTDAQLRPVIPCLVRMSLCASLDQSDAWIKDYKKQVLKMLVAMEVVNNVVSLLSIDFHALEHDAKQELRMRAKGNLNPKDSLLLSNMQQHFSLEFERSDSARKIRLVLSEILFVMTEIKEGKPFALKNSELFKNPVFLEEISDILCIAEAELPTLLPIEEVVEALLRFQNGSWILCRLVVNFPTSFHSVCHYLIMNGESHEENSLATHVRHQAVITLTKMSPDSRAHIFNFCISECKMADTAITLALQDSHSSIILLMGRLLLGNEISVRQWFSTFVKNSKKHAGEESILPELRGRLLQELEAVIQNEEENIMLVCLLLRVYASLKGIANLRFKTNECSLLLSLVIKRRSPNEGNIHLISVSLCFLLACPLIMTSENETKVIAWLHWLASEGEQWEKMHHVDGGFGEMLLLIAIHFHSNQTHAITELVSQTLQIKNVAKANALSRLKIIFTQDIFPEHVVAKHAVHVSVTSNLSAHIKGFLPVHCVYQLLQSRAFSKHSVPIHDWIFRQICNCSTPIHPLMVPLIKVYVYTVLTPAGKLDGLPRSTMQTNSSIAENDIFGQFENMFSVHETLADQKLKMPARLLLFFYLLQYQEILRSPKKLSSLHKVAPTEYSTRLMDKVPVKFLLLEARQSRENYGGLFSILLRLVIMQYPELCMEEEWLLDEEIDCTKALPTLLIKQCHCTPDALEQAFSEYTEKGNSSLLIALLDKLHQHCASDLISYESVIINNLSLLLDDFAPRYMVELVCKIWNKLHKLLPRWIRLQTVNALQSPRSHGTIKRTHADLINDVLIILQCDERVFSCPPVLQIVLRVLDGYLVASKSHFSRMTLKAVEGCESSEELSKALITAQDSVVVQILLEACLPRKPQESLLTAHREIQGIICSYLHQIFIRDPHMVKLIHFQCYPEELLPITVSRIPSMHVCLDFIPELLCQPDHEKQIFAILLVAHLCHQYALTRSLSLARLALTTLNTLLGILPADSRVTFFLRCLHAFPLMSRSFPPLAQTCVAFLVRLAQTCRTQLAHNHATLIADLHSVSSGSIVSLSSDIDYQYRQLYCACIDVFKEIVESTVLLENNVI